LILQYHEHNNDPGFFFTSCQSEHFARLIGENSIQKKRRKRGDSYLKFDPTKRDLHYFKDIV